MSQTIAAESKSNVVALASIPLGMHNSRSGSPGFAVVRPFLSGKTLRRAARLHPAQQLTNAELLEIAAENPPSPEWFDGEEECPFLK